MDVSKSWDTNNKKDSINSNSKDAMEQKTPLTHKVKTPT
jgi:hypothetical protein